MHRRFHTGFVIKKSPEYGIVSQRRLRDSAYLLTYFPARQILNRILNLPLFIRIPVCAVALAVIVLLFASRIFPGVPLVVLFALGIGAVAVAGVFLIAYFVVVAGWNTWSLDHGVTDTQWLRFDGEPSVLHGLRDDNDVKSVR
jgi:hypothetical protein